MTAFRFAVSVMPKDGILDPQGRAVEGSLPHLGIHTVRDVRVGRRVELTVDAEEPAEARELVDRLARELLANPLIEQWAVDLVGADDGPQGGGTRTAGPAEGADDAASRAGDAPASGAGAR